MATKDSQLTEVTSINQGDYLVGYIAGGNNFRMQKQYLSIAVEQVSGIDTLVRQTTVFGFSPVNAAVEVTDTLVASISKLQGQISAGVGGLVSFNGRTAQAVIPTSGDYTTNLVTEGANLYFTDARVRATPLTGFSATNAAVTAADSVLAAMGKLQGQINAGAGGLTSFNGRTAAAVIPASGDYTTSLVTEAANLYFTESRVRSTVLTGFSSINTVVSASDSVLSALGKLQGQISTGAGGLVSFNGRTTPAAVPADFDYSKSMITGLTDTDTPTFKGMQAAGAAIYLANSGSQSYIAQGNISDVTKVPKNWGIDAPVMGGTAGFALVQTGSSGGTIIASGDISSRFFTHNETHIKLASAGEPASVAFKFEYELSPWFDTTQNSLKFKVRLQDSGGSSVYTNTPNLSVGDLASTRVTITGEEPIGKRPNISFYKSDAPLNEKRWDIQTRNGGFEFRFLSDDLVTSTPTAFQIDRVGTAIGAVAFYCSSFYLFNTSYAAKQSGTLWAEISDENEKAEIDDADVSGAIERFSKLRYTNFYFKDDLKKSKSKPDCKRKGLIAQEVGKISGYENCVVTYKDKMALDKSLILEDAFHIIQNLLQRTKTLENILTKGASNEISIN